MLTTFITLDFNYWPNFVAWLTLFLEILGNTCIIIISCPVCDVINFKINQSFLTQPFFYITKKSGEKYISRRKRVFNMKKKAFGIIFKGLLIVRNCLRPESGPLMFIKANLNILFDDKYIIWWSKTFCYIPFVLFFLENLN